MPRGKRDEKRDHQRESKRDDQRDIAAPPEATDAEAQALSAFFRELATRAERDAAFGAGLLSVAQASGLARLTQGEPDVSAGQSEPDAPAAGRPVGASTTDASEAALPGPTGKRGRRRAEASASEEATAATTGATQATPDPFAVMRAQGEEGLRATLATLDLGALRQIVRMHRLDPARISARWANRDRVIALIVDQTRARLNHGRAFERV